MRKASWPVLWSPEADNDLIEIWNYLAREASQDIADRQLSRIHARASALGRLPFTGRKRDELVAGIRSVLVHPYVIFYRVADIDVQVVRVLHGRRDLDAIFSPEGTG